MKKCVRIFAGLVFIVGGSLIHSVQGNEPNKIILSEEIALPTIVIPYPESMENNLPDLHEGIASVQITSDPLTRPEHKIISEDVIPLIPLE